MKKRSVNILGHQTSITLEDEFWHALKTEAESASLSLNKLIAAIDNARDENTNLSSAIRLYILKNLQERINSHK
ncbi:MAG: ribbon-helix-helix domain-containing protein [Micavibrio sp.]|nr:ribbon-helix-helix domain-containing protein [Micavibrio sp.]